MVLLLPPKSGTKSPLQVDERNQHGDFVLSEGLPFTKNSDDGLFDSNDEIVFMAAAAGQDFTFGDVAPQLRESCSTMWKAAIHRGDRLLGYVLVCARIQPQRPPTTNLVQFDSKSQKIETDRYTYQFEDGRAALLGDIRIKKGAESTALFKDSRFVMALRLPWYLPDFNLTDQNFVSSVESWQTGPVRSIVAVGVKFKNFLRIFNLHLFSELVFYRSGLQIPTVIEFDFDIDDYLKLGSGLVYSIDYADGVDVELSTNMQPLPKSPEVYRDGKLSAASYPEFHVNAESDVANVMINVRVDPDAAKLVPPPFLVPANLLGKEADSWDWMEEMSGDLGVFLDISGVRKGLYDFGLDLLLYSRADGDSASGFQSVRLDWTVLTPK